MFPSHGKRRYNQSMIKVIMTWNIQEGKQQEYIEFAVSEFGPTLGALGMRISEVWYTVAGSDPEMVVLGVMPNRRAAEKLFAGYDWKQLEKRLMTFVEDITIKFAPPRAPESGQVSYYARSSSLCTSKSVTTRSVSAISHCAAW